MTELGVTSGLQSEETIYTRILSSIEEVLMRGNDPGSLHLIGTLIITIKIACSDIDGRGTTALGPRDGNCEAGIG